MLLLGLMGLTTYNVLGGRQLFGTQSYNRWQLSADARTVAAALTYLLEAEPPDLDIGTGAQWSVG
jgi:hypothetical protein